MENAEMDETSNQAMPEEAKPISFKAETRQILDILIHSLYTEREIFLRELISNASDALTRMDFEMLTNRDVFQPDLELAVRVIPDENEKTLTVEDSGIGMTEGELTKNLGTIAQSGAREFIAAAKQAEGDISQLIGQFGVGFYSAFMAAEWIRVSSRSYLKDSQAASWYSTGTDTFTVEPAVKEQRGTSVTIKLKDDASEFLDKNRLKAIIRRHSDFIPFPIYIGDESEQVNRQTAIWRQGLRELDEKDYHEFYKQLTLDMKDPLAYAHMAVDAPVQMYAILFVPPKSEFSMFSPFKERGLKLYAKKVLIQEYNRDLLPEYLAFVEGVVDSEDLPLNVSRETVQSTKIMATLKKLLTGKVMETLAELASENRDRYSDFWESYGSFIKQGVAIELDKPEPLYSLLQFQTTHHPETWSTLSEYVERKKSDQSEIYYILGEDKGSVLHSPHLDVARVYDYEVLLLTDPVDALMLTNLRQFEETPLKNIASADLKLPEDEQIENSQEPSLDESQHKELLERFQKQLGERITEARMTDRLRESPARLVDPQGAMNQEMQRVYRLFEKDYEIPPKVLELNPRHPIITQLSRIPPDDERAKLVIEQIYEDALLIEGLHPDPASMIDRIQKLIQAALEKN
jgi:molecular chaperone HtpG